MASNFVDPDSFKDPNDEVSEEEDAPPSATLRERFRNAASKARPFFQAAGATIGGTVAIAPAIASTALAPVVEAAGITAGYLGGNKLADIVEDVAGVRKPPEKPVNAFTQGANEVKEGVEQGLMGPILGKAFKTGVETVGKVGKHILGRWSGAGAGAVDTAVDTGRTLEGPNIFKSQNPFDEAMRGTTSERDAVNTAAEGWQGLRESRLNNYLKRLKELTSPTVTPGVGGAATSVQPAPMRKFISLKDIKQTADDVMKEAHVTVRKDGSLDFSSSALGKEGDRTLEDVLKKVRGWAGQMPKIQGLRAQVKSINTQLTDPKIDAKTKTNLAKKLVDINDEIKYLVTQNSEQRSAVGLDSLKRSLDDFYSESSNARAFVSRLRDRVNRTITDAIPEYKEMTKNYKESTEVINDIEQAFGFKSGRPINRTDADKILGKMTNVMKKDTSIRNELFEVLSKQGVNPKELTQTLAGLSMKEALPRSNIVLYGEGAALIGTLFNPQLAAVVAGSSPRVQGEVLRLFGKFLTETKGGSKVVGQAAALGLFGGKKPSEMTDEEIKTALKGTFENALGFGKEAIAAVSGPSKLEKVLSARQREVRK